jgi:hypothetical protein
VREILSRPDCGSLGTGGGVRDGQGIEGDLGEDQDMNNWTQKPLGSLCSIKTGKKDVNEGSPNGAYPFFTCSRDVHASDSYSFDTDAVKLHPNLTHQLH